jgi:hypothetical protein
VEWTELIKLIQEKEDPRLEFKESPFLKDSDDIAVQLVSFANRHGGRILVGVRDDGTIEGAKIDHDRRSLDILNIANNKCSPILEVSFDHSSSTEGDVLIVNVQKKRVIPHAIVDRKGAEIYKRTYYIRSEKGKRLVDDTILRSLFENTIDPNMSLTSSISLWYNRKGLVFSQIYSPTYMWYILPFVQDMSQPDREYILSNEIENIQSLLLELLPYAFLNHLKMTFISSWLIDKKKTKGI